MGLLDGILGQVAGNPDIKNLAAKVGLTPEEVETALTALGQAHPAPGDTVTTAAANTGMSADVLQQIVTHIGGEGALGHFAGLLAESGTASSLLGGLSGMFSKS